MGRSRAALEARFALQRGLCAYCQKQMEIVTDDPNQLATWDHFIPKSRGGSGKRENLVLACYPCNNAKGSMLASEFLRRLGK